MPYNCRNQSAFGGAQDIIVWLPSMAPTRLEICLPVATATQIDLQQLYLPVGTATQTDLQQCDN